MAADDSSEGAFLLLGKEQEKQVFHTQTDAGKSALADFVWVYFLDFCFELQ